ncbi:hypothetical protein [Curtobacterium sp. 458]|uniref:hypothetical protein n=1 Tax=Curtobacterium sp. 458 TaxID=3050069 RepID=UPI0025B4E011|nr:hypothetical protein [Curtobacterium sp. 458]WJX99994.1 hypothetical protein QPJ90_17130 [Curtobacterium sp. 458]
MSALDRALVAAAVAMTPAAHRENRREQWSADVQGAAELDLSPTALAFGAFTTAVFHRRADRRTTWGTAMTAAPLDVRPEPHRIRTLPVLVSVAIVSLLASGVWLLLQTNSASWTERVVGTLAGETLVHVVPGVAVALAILVLPVSVPRRWIGASTVLAATVVVVLLPFLSSVGPIPFEFSLLLTLLPLVGWFVATSTPWPAWTLAALPMVLTYAEHTGALWALLPAEWNPILVGVPYLALILAGFVASRFSTDRRRRFVAPERALVDKSA